MRLYATSCTAETIKILVEAGVFLEGHFLLTGGQHSDQYVEKNLALADPYNHSYRLGEMLAECFREAEVQTIVAPAAGAIALGQWVAYHLARLTERKVESVFAERERASEGQEFGLRRVFKNKVKGKKVLVVEDILTTGGSAKSVSCMVQAEGGEVIGVGAIVNRGKVTADDLGVPRLESLVEVDMRSWDKNECPLCKKGQGIDTPGRSSKT